MDACPEIVQRESCDAPTLRLVHETDRPISLQPHPKDTSLIVTPDGRWSSLVRRWRPGDVARCRLCPPGTCIADDNRCHILVEGAVPADAAPLWSTGGFARSVGSPARD